MEWLISELKNALNDINKAHKNSYNSATESRYDIQRAVGRVETIIGLLEEKY